MTEQEYLASIAERKRSETDGYPAVVRTTDPLLIRVNPVSLLVNDTNFYAKIKTGLAFNGYYIYSSGLGTHIAEVKLPDITEQVTIDGQNIKRNKPWSDSKVQEKASEFLDRLEARIAIMPSTNAIKEAIDRLCWQTHYDLTQSDTDFVRSFADQGFTQTIGIDYKKVGTTAVPTNCYPAETLYPIRVTAFDSAHEITGSSGSTVITYGSLYDVATKLDTLDTDFNSKIGTLNNNIKDTNDATLSSSMNKIAINLRADGSGANEEYTISKALRDKAGNDEKSVSGAVYQQTQLEQEHFETISEDQLGAFGATIQVEGAPRTNKTLFDSLGSYGEYNEDSLSRTIGTKNDVYNEGTLFSVNRSISNKLGAFDEKDSSNSYTNEENVYNYIYYGDSGNLNDFSAIGRLRNIQERIGLKSDTESSDSLFGKIAGVKGDTSYIGRDTTTTNKLWYDVLHNAGVGDSTAATAASLKGKVDNICTKINNVYLTATDTGQTLPSIRSWSSNGHWGT